MPCFIYSFRQKIKSNFHRLLPLFLIPVFFFGSSLPSYAASTEFIPFYYAAYGNYIESGNWSGLAESGIAIISKGATSNRDCLVLPVYVVNQDSSSNLFVTLYTNVGQISQEIELVISGADGDVSYSPYSVIDSSQLSNIASGYHIITFKVPFSGNFFRIRWNSDIGTEVVCIVSESLPSSGVNSDVIQAIQNQTDEIMGAGSDNSGTVDNIESGNSDLEDYISDYTEIEQSMHDNFVETQAALNGDFTGFSWGSLSTCLNWVSDYLQQIYLNSGDFKMMITLPLLLGIALFFIGRGSLVFGEMTRDKSSDKANKDFDFTFRD